MSISQQMTLLLLFCIVVVLAALVANALIKEYRAVIRRLKAKAKAKNAYIRALVEKSKAQDHYIDCLERRLAFLLNEKVNEKHACKSKTTK